MPRGPEYRIIRWDFELTKMKRRGILSAGEKGEAVERLIGVEINSAVPTSSGRQITNRGRIGNKKKQSSECDLIFRGDWSGSETGDIVNGSDVVCIIEVKTDLKKSDIEGQSSSINQKVEQLREFTEAPIFIAGVRHDNTPSELRNSSIADETVGLGPLKDQGSAEKMANEGEFKRLTSAVNDAIQSFDE